MIEFAAVRGKFDLAIDEGDPDLAVRPPMHARLKKATEVESGHRSGLAGFHPKLTSTNRPEIRPRVRRPKWAHRVALPTRVDWAIIGRFNPAPVRGMCRETR